MSVPSSVVEKKMDKVPWRLGEVSWYVLLMIDQQEWFMYTV